MQRIDYASNRQASPQKHYPSNELCAYLMGVSGTAEEYEWIFTFSIIAQETANVVPSMIHTENG